MVPESPLQSLPTILRINSIAPIRSYSKAPGVFSSICRYAASLPRLYFHRAGPRDSFPVVTPFVHVGTSCFQFDLCLINQIFNPLLRGAQTISSSQQCKQLCLRILPFPAWIHLECFVHYLLQTRFRMLTAVFHQFADSNKVFKVFLLT